MYRAHRFERALDTPAHIYYKYEGTSPAGLAQAKHGGAAGVLQPRGGRAQARHRDRRRTVGLGARVRLPADGHRVPGVHGRLELRPEAVPPLDDGGVGRDRAPQPVERDRGRPRAGLAPDRARSASRSRRRSRWRPATRTPTTRSAPCSTTCCCTRPSVGPGVGRADGEGRRVPGRRDRLRRRRVQLRRHRGAVRAREPARGQADALRRGRAGRLPDAHARHLPLRLRRHDGHDAADADVHARPRLRAAADARRRPALPRRRAARVRPRAGGYRRGARLPPERDLRGGGALRARRGHHPRARARARDPRGDRGGRGGARGRARSG